MIRILSIQLFICLIITNCAPARYVKPLKKNQQVAAFSFGGPIIEFAGAAIPIPYTTFGYAYGLSDKITAYSNLHTTSLLFSNIQLDAGATIGLYEKEKKFGFSISPAVQIASSLKAKNTLRVWPSTDINFYYHLKEKESYLYSGLNAWFDMTSKKAHHEKQNTHVLPSLQFGYVISKNKWNHQFQLSYLGIGMSNLPNVPTFVGISHKGTLGFYYALIRKF